MARDPLDAHRTALHRSRQQVEQNERTWRDSIRARNVLVRKAKAAGMPAAEAYDLAGVNQSTYSRQAGATGPRRRPASRS
jgi:hypothetical protein